MLSSSRRIVAEPGRALLADHTSIDTAGRRDSIDARHADGVVRATLRQAFRSEVLPAALKASRAAPDRLSEAILFDDDADERARREAVLDAQDRLVWESGRKRRRLHVLPVSEGPLAEYLRLCAVRVGR